MLAGIINVQLGSGCASERDSIKSYKKSCNESYPAGNYMFKVNNRNTRTRCKMFKITTIKAPGVVLVSFFLTLNIFHTL